MNKRKVKKKFHLTCKEFKIMTLNDPRLLRYIETAKPTHSVFASNALEEAVFFWKGERVTNEEYYNNYYKLEKEVC